MGKDKKDFWDVQGENGGLVLIVGSATDADDVFLRVGQPSGALFGDDDHLLDGYDAPVRDFDPGFDGEDHIFFELLEGFLGVLFPLGTEEGGAVVGVDAQLMAEAVGEFLVACVGDDLPGDGVDGEGLDAGPDGLLRLLDGLGDGVERVDDGFGGSGFVVLEDVEGALHVGDVVVVPDAEVDVQDVSLLDDVLAGSVVRFGAAGS